MPTVEQVLATIFATIPGAPPVDTVDTIKVGDPAQEVSGIVTTFLATHDVIRQTIARGANLIITHEPTFYNHRDEVDWLADDPVYEAKRRLLEEQGIAVWRLHDSWHMRRPDGIMTGVLRQLEWAEYALPELPGLCEIPPISLDALVAWFKAKMGICNLRLIGDGEMICRRVGLAIGASGGRRHITALGQAKLDVLAVGELHEWETAEYVRDAQAQGRRQALVVLGHAASEEAGMGYLAEWLAERLPEVEIVHIPAGDAFRYV
ncbi:MAG: Nif3-like dinuclear metal center hexameric protein [Chloroflexi bacterium]|nr:Nif3-like dinuclear metal center hexameric protein [Chloroflexota bacterium]